LRQHQPSDYKFIANPQVTVQVQRSDLPDFFARIWTHDDHRQSIGDSRGLQPFLPPGNCAGPDYRWRRRGVKPWLLPNMTPPQEVRFQSVTGAIADPTLLVG